MNRTKPHQSPVTRAVCSLTPRPPLPEARRRPVVRPPIPDTNIDLALIDVTGFCALVCMSESWVWEGVGAGTLPQPALRLPRCTRWRLADVRAWIVENTAKTAAQVAA